MLTLNDRRGWELLYSDAFEEPLLGQRWLSHRGHWSVADGALIPGDQSNSVLILDVPVMGDFRLEWVATCSTDMSSGLCETAVFSSASKSQLHQPGYLVAFGSRAGVRFERRGRNVLQSPARFRNGSTVELRLERIGRRFELRVDGVEKAVYLDPIPVSQNIGWDLVGLSAISNNTKIEEVRVWHRKGTPIRSALDLGDGLFEQGRFAESAEAFARVQLDQPRTLDAWEAAYREGVSFLELARMAEDGSISEDRYYKSAEGRFHDARHAPSPIAQFGQVAEAEGWLVLDNPSLALRVATEGVESDPILQSALRPFLARVTEFNAEDQHLYLERFAEVAHEFFTADAWLMTVVWGELAILQRRRGRLDESLALFCRIQEEYEAYPVYVSWAFVEEARNLVFADRPEQAISRIDQKIKMASMVDYRTQLWLVRAVAAAVAKDSGQLQVSLEELTGVKGFDEPRRQKLSGLNRSDESSSGENDSIIEQHLARALTLWADDGPEVARSQLKLLIDENSQGPLDRWPVSEARLLLAVSEASAQR